jgi:hypothetical protein
MKGALSDQIRGAIGRCSEPKDLSAEPWNALPARTSLGSEVKAEVALSQELASIEGYLAIEQTRFGERLRIDMDVSSETRDAMVPNMMLQPLVENAVRYGVAPLVEGGWISIKSAQLCELWSSTMSR